MSLINEKDYEHLKADILNESFRFANRQEEKDSYFMDCDNNIHYIEKYNPSSLPELSDLIVKSDAGRINAAVVRDVSIMAFKHMNNVNKYDDITNKTDSSMENVVPEYIYTL